MWNKTFLKLSKVDDDVRTILANTAPMDNIWSNSVGNRDCDRLYSGDIQGVIGSIEPKPLSANKGTHS
jgi:hypothetical protein